MKKVSLLLIGIFAFMLVSAQSNNEEVELVQSAFGMEKKAMVAEFVKVDATQKDAFWKLYHEYETARKDLGKKRIDLLNQYADNFDKLTNEFADSWAKQVLDVQKKTRGDAGRLSQVFLNLITNARDAMPRGGKLVVESRARDSSLHVSFSDTGIGIPPENMGRIFDFLFTTKGAKGTGYGLTISKDIVEEHGGRIEVQSQPGEGSTFTVVLPLESGPRVA